MTEKNMEALSKELLYKPVYPGDKDASLLEEAIRFCEGYKQYLDTCKTEREVVDTSLQMLLDAGYTLYDDEISYKPGDKIYFISHEKSLVAATIGSANMDYGFRMTVAHVDAPRLDLKPLPLYEKDHFSLLKTHYYGGVRKYQWATIPLALHGVFCKTNGETVKVNIGEDEGDPVFCITDLLPHLGADQNARKLSEGIRGEELNVLVGSQPVADEALKDRIKLNTMLLLNQKYGIVERDFARAEIEVVPAFKARDIGFDRSMVGAYGQDDRVDAYPALLAEINCKNPVFTTICVLTDKEEVGSNGVSGMQSDFTFQMMESLCKGHGSDYLRAFRHSICLSADVTAAYDPTWSSAFEPLNSSYAGQGIAIAKYTGSRGKSGCSDANAELVAYVTGLCEKNGIAWQIGEMGAVDQGGGGTISKFVANRGIPTIDIGVPVLSMHAPFEITHKIDVLMAYKTFSAFNCAEE